MKYFVFVIKIVENSAIAMLAIKIRNNGGLINFYIICMTYSLRKFSIVKELRAHSGVRMSGSNISPMDCYLCDKGQVVAH